MKARLQAHGVEVLGITDHHIFKSIYFFDPNGVRLELSAQVANEFQMLQGKQDGPRATQRMDGTQAAMAGRPRRGQGRRAS
jgi:glyoxylase I family protein